ncbi:MAG: hypothetical protein PHP25_01695 [Candidatus Moranbacteria bacterium]|nr:hypothetical protein [Candidatus Moranbacteria bacterium]
MKVLSIMSGYQTVATIEALEVAGATEELFRIVRGNPAAAKAMVDAGNKFLRNQYADEQSESSYTYPKSYAVKPITEQIAMLSKLFGLDGTKALAYAKNLPELPEGAESYFAIPRWQAVSKTYGKAVEKMLALIAKGGTLEDWLEGKLDEKHLRQSERTERMFAKFCEQQEGDILVIPAQFGLRHRGKSFRRARETFDDNEFGLGAFAVGCMLLTHPEREQEWEQLHVDCAGDEFAPDADGQFVSAPHFDWSNGKLRFYAGWAHVVHWQFGSASGLAPQG